MGIPVCPAEDPGSVQSLYKKNPYNLCVCCEIMDTIYKRAKLWETESSNMTVQ